jgi:hypothetical protein
MLNVPTRVLSDLTTSNTTGEKQEQLSFREHLCPPLFILVESVLLIFVDFSIVFLFSLSSVFVLCSVFSLSPD